MAFWCALKPAAVALYWLRVVPKAASVWRCNLGYGFDKHYRLLKTEDFSSVFALRKQHSRHFIQVFYSQDNGRKHPRLGLVVAKKVAKRAHQRNYMKRVIREWFRHRKDVLPARDFVVRVRTAFDRQPDVLARVHAQLNELTSCPPRR